MLTSSRRLYSSPIVDLVVGEEKKVYHVHKEVLCSDSSFFATALKDDTWKEGQEGIITLREEQPAIMSLIVQWLYTRSLAYDESSPDAPDLLTLCELYGAADRLRIPGLPNAAVDAFRKRCSERLGTGSLPSEIYTAIHEYTAPDSGFRWLIMDGVVHEVFTRVDTGGRPSDILDFISCTNEFATEVNVGMITKLQEGRCPVKSNGIRTFNVNTTNPYKIGNGTDWCFYHDHPDGERCTGLPLPEHMWFVILSLYLGLTHICCTTNKWNPTE